MQLRLWLFILVFMPHILLADNKDTASTKSTSNRPKVKFLPNGYYRPETRIALGTFILVTFKANQKDTISRWSYFKSTLVATQNKQLALENDWVVFFKKEKVSLYGSLDLMHFPEYFYGIGNNTLKDSSEFYELKRIAQNTLLLRNINGFYFAGLNFDTQYLFGYNPTKAITRYDDKKSTRGYFANGIGPTFLFDSRDNSLIAHKGWYNELTLNYHSQYTLSDFNYTTLILNSRKFIPVFKKKCIWATEVYGNFNAGTVPFRANPAIGGFRFLRGYYTGRFRDKNLVFAQTELRMPLFWRFGFVTFAGMGQVAPDLKSISLQQLKYTAGGGLRFFLSKKENASIRMDYGFSNEGGGLYIVFGEAF